jgi:hypothetical protein
MRGVFGRRRLQGTALALIFALGGCAIPKPLNPVLIYNRVSGRDEAKRPPPPGMDAPSPNLGAIPPRPERPPPGATDAITAALIEDRLRSGTPQPDRARAAPPAAYAPGNPPIPAGPPPLPPLAAAPAVPWDLSPPTGPVRPAGRPGAPAALPPAAPALPVPGAIPPPPPPDLLGLPR